MYSPIKASDPPKIKSKKDQYFNAWADKFAEELEVDLDAEAASIIVVSSKPDPSILFRF